MNFKLSLWLIFEVLVFLLATVIGLPVRNEVGRQGKVGDEQFHEGLLLRPLPDRKVLAHFHFQSSYTPSSSNARHHHLFPKSISQLVQKFRIREMELSFTQGRWNYERWGGFDSVSSNNGKAPGVEFWAVFEDSEVDVDASWKNLTHALSGLFCASINFLDSSTMYSAPKLGFGHLFGNLRYGVLPREAVCTENLTPWLKLLPCRDKDGLSALLDRPAIYRGFYHSQQLHLALTDSRLVLDQTLTLVLSPGGHSGGNKFQPNWSLSTIFGRNLYGKCSLAESSYVYLQLDKGLVSELEKITDEDRFSSSRRLWNESFFDFAVQPNHIFREKINVDGQSYSVLFEFDVGTYNDSHPLDVGLSWKFPSFWSCKQGPFRTSRFLMGSGNERGAIGLLLQPIEHFDSTSQINMPTKDCKVIVEVFQVVPWYIKVYYHTIRLLIDEQPKAIQDYLEKIHISPSTDKVSPGVMELVLKLPCSMKSTFLSLEFDKGFLHIDEYPPDANQGFDIPSAIIRFPDFYSKYEFLEMEDMSRPPILSKLQDPSPVISYTEVLLVPLTSPDFSMPYNVITITCTVFALYFGSLLNVLRRRVEEEKRVLRSKTAGKGVLLPPLLANLVRKLSGRNEEPTKSSSAINYRLVIKVCLVALLAVAWKFYSE